PSGYTAGSWSCDGGTPGTDAITLALGDTVTCTINNNDTAPTLKLVKTVTTDNGGSAGPADWTLAATAAANDTTNFISKTASPVFHTVRAGTQYTLSESGGPSGYTAGSWSCDGGVAAR